MKKISLFGSLLLATMVLKPMGIQAQVTIGNGKVPENFSVLELISNNKMGLRLPQLTTAERDAMQAGFGALATTEAAGLQIFNLDTHCVETWTGFQWVTNCEVTTTKTFVEAITQPQPFTFYERGTETPAALTFTVTGTSAITYEWRKITGSNIYVRISEPCTAADGTGFDSASFTPTSVIKGTTEVAGNTGFYRYFCVATDQTGDEVTSNLAEVAVGCGAKDLNGEWLSFMCHNLGASANLTIAAQKATVITLTVNPANTSSYLRSANERTVYGDLYQWGRIADGHQNRNAIPINGTGGEANNYRAWDTTTPPTYENGLAIGSIYYPTQQVARSSAYYGRFIGALPVANYYNWYTGSTRDANMLWRTSAFAANDPCQKVKTDGSVPSGNVAEWYLPSSTSPTTSGTNWRIPNQGEWASLYRGGTTSGNPANALANSWVWFNNGDSSNTNGTKGYEVKPDNVTTTLFLPASGRRHRNNGMLYNTGSGGYYWSASKPGDETAFSLNLGSTGVMPATENDRGYGLALRCIKN